MRAHERKRLPVRVRVCLTPSLCPKKKARKEALERAKITEQRKGISRDGIRLYPIKKHSQEKRAPPVIER